MVHSMYYASYMTNDTYTLREISPRLSAGQREDQMKFIERQIKHWVSSDLLRPIGDKHTGMGRSRYYTKDEVIIAAYLHELTKYGVTIGQLKEFRETYDKLIKDPKNKAILYGEEPKSGPPTHYLVYNVQSSPKNVGIIRTYTGGYEQNLADTFIVPLGKNGEDTLLSSGLIICCYALISRLDL